MNTHTPKKPPALQRLNAWVRAHKKKAVILASVLVVVISASVATGLYFLLRPDPAPAAQVAVQAPEPEPEPIKYFSPLTGSLVESEAITKQAVTSIMIENSPDARPHSGLKNSGVIFEAIAEGGITRFLVLYQEQKPQLIGPVRSLRMYNVDWLAAFDASVAHIGGSAAALAEVRNGSYRDIDQFFNSAAYYRASDRFAPHNVYTTFERLDALNLAKGYTTSEFTGFLRKDSKAAEVPTATSINVTISSPLFNSSYVYAPATNTYDRSQGGALHTDREEGQISPRVVIVMKVAMQTVLEDGFRQQINTIGSGSATIFQDGLVVEGTWTKKSRTDQITFADAAGQPIELARGQTWITAVPAATGAVTWQ